MCCWMKMDLGLGLAFSSIEDSVDARRVVVFRGERNHECFDFFDDL